MTDREAMKIALDALEMHVLGFDGVRKMELAIEALEAALAQPEQESKPMYVMGNYAGEGKVVSASFGLPKGAFEFAPYTGKGEASKIKHSLEQMLGQEPTACGYDETVGMCTNNPCCEQTPIAHLWECIGRWSAYLASNGEKANLAPPEWLVDAVKAATAPQRKPWVGLTDNEIALVLINSGYTAENFARAIEAKLKEKNT